MRTKKTWMAAVAALALASPAAAQQPPRPSPSQQLVDDWTMFSGALSHVGRGIGEVLKESDILKKEVEQLRKDLAAAKADLEKLKGEKPAGK